METIGLIWDRYTPAVEGQITRDIIALQASSGNQGLELVAVCTDDKADSLLRVLGVNKGIAEALARLWIIYQTGPDAIDEPENAETIILRDLYVAPSETGLLDPDSKPGFYMEPQGRVIAPQVNLNRPMPSHSGPTDPHLILLWS